MNRVNQSKKIAFHGTDLFRTPLFNKVRTNSLIFDNINGIPHNLANVTVLVFGVNVFVCACFYDGKSHTGISLRNKHIINAPVRTHANPMTVTFALMSLSAFARSFGPPCRIPGAYFCQICAGVGD